MEILLDNPETDRLFQEILAGIRRLKNGETAAQMKAMGAKYRLNWGASVVSLRQLAKNYKRDHLLALKLWNKQWRESMILATLLEEPDSLTEEQMDYWTKSFETAEMAEQAVSNLFVSSKFAFAKAFEYCCGKKHWVRYTGVLMAGRLAMTDKRAINEMFEGFFEVIYPLMKDASLAPAIDRSMVIIGSRNDELRDKCIAFMKQVLDKEDEQARQLALIILEELQAGMPNQE